MYNENVGFIFAWQELSLTLKAYRVIVNTYLFTQHFSTSFTDVVDVSVGLTLYRILEVNEKLEVIRMRIWERYVNYSFNS